MDATSRLVCWDWTYLMGTIKYGRTAAMKKVENLPGMKPGQSVA